MEYNHAPISLREGHVYLDGVTDKFFLISLRAD